MHTNVRVVSSSDDASSESEASSGKHSDSRKSKVKSQRANASRSEANAASRDQDRTSLQSKLAKTSGGHAKGVSSAAGLATITSSSDDASSSEVSDSDSSTSSSPSKKPRQTPTINTAGSDDLDSDSNTSSARSPTPVAHFDRAEQKSATAAFSEFYLKAVTAEFANDLEKLRRAPDFRDSSLEMLIRALKQGEECFREEEKERVGRAILEAK